MRFELDRTTLLELGLEVSVRGDDVDEPSFFEPPAGEQPPTVELASEATSSTLVVELSENRIVEGFTGELSTRGAILFVAGARRATIGNLTLRAFPGDRFDVADTLGGLTGSTAAFDVGSLITEVRGDGGEFSLVGELLLSSSLAGDLGIPGAAGIPVGRILLRATLLPASIELARTGSPTAGPGNGTASPTAIGPDVIVGNLHEVRTYGATGGVAAFSIGTVSCNIGDVWVNWFANTNQHPAIATNMYRLKGGRFEQIGISWVKHGFFALSEASCSSDCQPTNGSHLGVHCSDPYSAYLNGQQANLGPRSQINPHTGYFPYPPANPSYSGILARRVQVPISELDPTQNGGGLYFVEGQYVTADDAAAGHQNNNASYRPVTISFDGATWNADVSGSVRRQKPAIRAWRDNDSFVVETDIQIADDGLLILAAKSTDLGAGWWRYEYAVENLNSHRAGRSFSIPIDPAGTIRNVGFHDVAYHSGEPYSSTDWTVSTTSSEIAWSTEDYSVNQNANALRWGTLYNFRFDANRQPITTDARLGLFRPGDPSAATASTVGPNISEADCNNNDMPDTIDIQNGTSVDCDGDNIPDECESFAPTTVKIVDGLDRPVYVTAAPGDDQRLFIVEQPGRIKILSGPALLATPFLDISSLVSSTGERGLLSMAFDPNHAANGYFYVDYTDLAGDTVIARYQVSTNANIANPGSATILKVIAQDSPNHNGGQLQFGPDGYLYAGMGDGGSAYDPFNRAQDIGSLLGKMLRLEVNNPPAYTPETNPYFGPGLPLDEIWASGLGNPRRFSFDRSTGDLYIADVGQNLVEEINLQPRSSSGGENYGWRCMEGTACTGLTGCVCSSPSLTLPVHEFAHGTGDCSVTGGYVYRGCVLPNFLGAYFYADYCSGAIRSFRYQNGQAFDHQDLTAAMTPPEGPITSIVSFGEDAAGELLIVSHDGAIYRIVPDPTGGAVCGNGVLEVGEFCDDGNTLPGDGCDEGCRVETGARNDRCSLAAVVGEGMFPFDTTGATTDGPDEAGFCQSNPGAVGSDIWYCYTPTQSGTATASLCGSGYDSMIAGYASCACPTASSAFACSDDSCSDSSSISFSATACDSYLIRVGGFMGAQGGGMLTLTNQTNAIVTDCDGNGVEDADDLRCGTYTDGNQNGIPDTCETSGDYLRGGRLYDNWWVEAALPAPGMSHPLWAFRPDLTSNPRTGSATWRCKECHGWDYLGADGQYGTGDHRTGFGGLLGTTLSASDMFALLREPPSNGGGGVVLNGHNYGSVLPDTRINDLVAFVLQGVIDDDPVIDAITGDFRGDPASGEVQYEIGGDPACLTCHGAAGTAINFGTPSKPEFVGTLARYNPWELLHKIRFAQPGAPMPSLEAGGHPLQGAVDIGRYAQLAFPADCLADNQCDDGLACTADSCDDAGDCLHAPNDASCAQDGEFCNGPEACDPAVGCASAGNPCTVPSACNELSRSCGCSPPKVSAAGARYLAVTPHPSGSTIPSAIVVEPACDGATPKYVGAPFGEHNVAVLLDDPGQAAYLTAKQWGQTVNVTGQEVAPGTEYLVRADCGRSGTPASTAATAATTLAWGDLTGHPTGGSAGEPNGIADVFDIAAVVDRIKGLPSALPVPRLDLLGCTPDQHVNVIDLAGTVDAVKGISLLAGSRCPGPCW